MAVPSTTEPGLPIADENGEVITWAVQGFRQLQALVESQRTTMEVVRRGLSAEWISGWYQPVDAAPSDAWPIDWRDELLGKPLRVGTYYVRIYYDVPGRGESILYYKANAASGAADPRNQMQAGVALERELESVSATSAAKSIEIDRQFGQISDLRAEINLVKDQKGELERALAATEAALAQAEEDAAPIFEEKTAVKFLEVFQMWASQPDGAAKGYFGTLFGAVVKFVSAISGDAEIMAGIVARHAESWETFRGAFNVISKQAQQQTEFSSATRIAELLPPGLRPGAKKPGANGAGAKKTIKPALRAERR